MKTTRTLKHRRKALNLTQASVATALGCGVPLISMLERGYPGIKKEWRDRYTEYLVAAERKAAKG